MFFDHDCRTEKSRFDRVAHRYCGGIENYEVLAEVRDPEGWQQINTVRKNRIPKETYRIGLMSNTEMPMVRFFKTRKYKWFDPEIFSCKVGARKPEAKIYEILLRKLELKPEEIVFIDDRKENIDAANQIGINGILFKNSKQLKKDLLTLSVKL